MEVICINGEFDAETLAFWAKHGVGYPKEGGIYNIDSMIRHANGVISVYLSEFAHNPKVPILHPILGVQLMHVGFCRTRFTDLMGRKLEMVKETALPSTVRKA